MSPRTSAKVLLAGVLIIVSSSKQLKDTFQRFTCHMWVGMSRSLRKKEIAWRGREWTALLQTREWFLKDDNEVVSQVSFPDRRYMVTDNTLSNSSPVDTYTHDVHAYNIFLLLGRLSVQPTRLPSFLRNLRDDSLLSRVPITARLFLE